MTTLQIIDITGLHNEIRIKEKENSNILLVPRVGERVDMGYGPLATVRDVLWQYDFGEDSNDTVVIVKVE